MKENRRKDGRSLSRGHCVFFFEPFFLVDASIAKALPDFERKRTTRDDKRTRAYGLAKN